MYKSEVLNFLGLGVVVRVSMQATADYYKEVWTHDAPYLKIIEVNTDQFLGEVLDTNRDVDCNMYPAPIGERLWFTKENVIEIPLNEVPQKQRSKFKGMLDRATRVPLTGPLFTIIYEPSEEEDSESASSGNDGYSDYSTDVSIHVADMP